MLMSDLRYGLRTLLKNPAFAGVAVLTLALGIGANTVIFSVVKAVILSPLPFGEPERIVGVFTINRAQAGELDVFSPANFSDVAEQSRALEAVAAWRYWGFDVSGESEPERLTAGRVSPAFFRALGVSPILGRVFLPEDDATGTEHVVVLGHGLWQKRFGGDPAICGRTIQLNGESHLVLGVMPRGFEFPAGAEIWAPLGLNESQRQQRGSVFLEVLARLGQGITLEAAQSEMGTIASRLEKDYPGPNTSLGMTLIPLHDQIVGSVRPALLVLSAAVTFVLLVGCANLANLLLASASARQREFAVRAALGASRGRLIRQLLTESVLLSLIGGGLGVLISLWGLSALAAFGPGNVPRLGEVSLDAGVLIFTLLLSVVTGVLFGLAPALGASRSDLQGALKAGARTAGTDLGRSRLRATLVIAEVALVLVLLASAGLMMKSFLRLRSVDPGFNPDRLMSLQFFLPQPRYPQDQSKIAFESRLLEKIRSLPGVVGAATASPAPIGAIPMRFENEFRIAGRPEPEPGSMPVARYNRVGPGYFRTLGVPLLRGREFAPSDDAGAPAVAIISELTARRHWPDEDPLGRRIIIGERQPITMEIVGVVGDVKQISLDDTGRPTIYVPFSQRPSNSLNVMIRTSGPPADLAGAIKQQLWAVDRDIPADYLETAESLISRSLAQPRFTMVLLACFAGMALVLAMVGIFGVIAYSVTQRTQEIGVRMALGANRGDVLRMVLGHGMGLTAIGVALGLAGSAALTRYLSSLLFQVSATDPMTFGWVTLLLVAVALFASWIPARRATRVDPMVALRHD